MLHNQSEAAALQRFNYLIERFEKRFSDRFASFNLVVNMGMGMATLGDDITRRDWQRFIVRPQLARHVGRHAASLCRAGEAQSTSTAFERARPRSTARPLTIRKIGAR